MKQLSSIRPRASASTTSRLSSSRRANAFSLVELLVVIGILSVLVALLLSALSKARRHAYQVTCLSNLRQLGTALTAYAGANRGWFPTAAVAGMANADDWVYWQKSTLPFVPNRDPAESRIVPYLGSLEVLKCPLGVPDRQVDVINGSPYAEYPYSYSVNVRFTGYGEYGRRSGSPCNLTHVVNASHKVLAIEEDITKINDGSWWALGSEYPNNGTSSVSVRHARNREYGTYEKDLGFYWRRGRGNVVFADGHGEFLYRWFLQYRAYVLPDDNGAVLTPSEPEVW